MKKINFLIIIIVLVAAVLRLWELGSVPASPDWDEAALGYNAYSILQTGRDEYGKFLPVVLQSFNDYKPALYTYLAMPSVAIFNLNTFAVRLPSAIFGILTVLATYFLLKELFAKKSSSHKVESYKEKNEPDNIKTLKLDNSLIPIVATALLAISPWHIQFSRIAFEANIGLAFNIFTVLFFLKGLRKPWLLSLSAANAALAIYAYQSQKVFTPLLILILVILFGKKLLKLPKKFIFSAVIVGVLVLLPTLHFFITNENAFSRAKGVSVFSEQTYRQQGEQEKYLGDKSYGNLSASFFHNKYIAYVREFSTGYLKHFSLNWYFIKGDLERHHAPGMGMLYLWELPFLLIGIYGLLFFNFPKRTKLLIFLWFVLAPVPAAFAIGAPHSIRTLSFLPTFQVFTAIGLISSFAYIAKLKYEIAKIPIKYLIFAFYLLFLILNVSYYLNQYFVQQNYFYSKDWQYGYEDAVSFVQQNEHKYKKVVVSNISPLDQSYMFFLFYLKYSPADYQRTQDLFDEKSGSFDDSHSFDKYEFRPIDWEKEEKSNTLFVGRPDDLPRSNMLKQINYLNGEPAIFIIEGK